MSDFILLLDGESAEPIELPPGEPRILGRDPLAALDHGDPLQEQLAAMVSDTPRRERAPTREAPSRRRPLRIPTLAEIEVTDRGEGAARWLGDDLRRRLAALEAHVQGESDLDRFGFSPKSLRDVLPVFHALYRHYFRTLSEGHERVPQEGPVVLAANHGGLLPFDGAMCVLDLLIHSDPPRLLRSVVERWAGSVPWVNLFLARTGQVIGTRENVRDLLADDQALLVFPEGVEGVRKPYAKRYQLQAFHVGFVEEALRARAPIVPVAILGADDQAPLLFDVKPLARWLGLPVAPITPTFPLLGLLGLLPYPVRYRIFYGEPLDFHTTHGPEAAEDAQLVRYLANQVRRVIQQMIDRNRS